MARDSRTDSGNVPRAGARGGIDEHVAGVHGDVAKGLRRALIATYGVDVGNEAAADAIAWAWAHRDRLATMHNPGGYLFRVGQSSARKYRRPSITMFPAVEPQSVDALVIEPRLPNALASLSARQRGAVLLVHAHGYSYSQAAALLGISVSALRLHLARGLRSLRTTLGEDNDD